MKRYEALERRLESDRRAAFVPFFVLGDPSLEMAMQLIDDAVAAGADALELGFPYSDPLCDGPVIQRAAQRALAGGATHAAIWDVLAKTRARHPDVPIGLLVYANAIIHTGIDEFYRHAAMNEIDSVLVPDLPPEEAGPWLDIAERHGIAPVFVATPGVSAQRTQHIAALTGPYTYVLRRRGVTGVQANDGQESAEVLARLAASDSPPKWIGFGIETPEDVLDARRAGADGIICGSALIAEIERHLDDTEAMRRAIRERIDSLRRAVAE